MIEVIERPAASNPLLHDWHGPDGAPPFDRVRTEDFLPAFRAAIDAHRDEIAVIATDEVPATFESVIVPLERAGALLGRVSRLFWTLSSAQSEPAIRAIEPDVSALLSAHATETSHDPMLFARVDAVWQVRETFDLDEEQSRLLANVRRGFVSGGALLGANAKARFAAIDAALADLSVRFGQNVLAAAAGWEMLLDESDLDGLSAGLRGIAARRAAGKGAAGRFLFTLDRGEVEDFLAFCTRRDLRERIWRAFTGRGDGGAHDNWPILSEIAALRHERADLLGFPNYAACKLEDSMAKTPAAAAGLMERVWGPAREQAFAEASVLQARIDSEGGGFTLAPWDWRFFAEAERRERYALDGAAVKAYLTLDAVRDAAFDCAGRLFGLRFERRDDLPGYHPDVRAWAVSNENGSPVGLLYTDYFARPEKHGGAWMGSLRVQKRMDGPVRPIVYTVANFAKAPEGEETRLSLDEARTLFHEFGHALHALLSDVTYPSLAGTAVARDFVEFPSKFMENWIIAPEVLASFGVPDALIAAIGTADAFGQGFGTVEFLLSAIVDLAIHSSHEHAPDIAAIEADAIAALDPPPAICMRHRLPHFTHIFDGGYAGAYYSYLWSEVLDADGFEAFREAGDIFDSTLAARYRSEVLARGDGRDPMASFVAFRGREPDEAALIRARRL